MRDAVGHRADTADARRSAIAPDALLRRALLRRQVPKQPATPADFGERTAWNETGGAAGAADHSGGDCSGQPGIDPPHARTLHGDAALARALPGGAPVRLALSRRPPALDPARPASLRQIDRPLEVVRLC